MEVPVSEDYEQIAEEFKNRNIYFGEEITPLVIADVTDLEGFKNFNLAEE